MGRSPLMMGKDCEHYYYCLFLDSTLDFVFGLDLDLNLDLDLDLITILSQRRRCDPKYSRFNPIDLVACVYSL